MLSGLGSDDVVVLRATERRSITRTKTMSPLNPGPFALRLSLHAGLSLSPSLLEATAQAHDSTPIGRCFLHTSGKPKRALQRLHAAHISCCMFVRAPTCLSTIRTFCWSELKKTFPLFWYTGRLPCINFNELNPIRARSIQYANRTARMQRERLSAICRVRPQVHATRMHARA